MSIYDDMATRGGVEDTRLEAKAKDTKNPRPRPRTAHPRTDLLKAKDRKARGQGHKRKCFPKKRSSKKMSEVISKKKKKKKMSSKQFFRRSAKF